MVKSGGSRSSRKTKKYKGGEIRSVSPNHELFTDETFLRIVENTRIINKEKNKSHERQSDEYSYAMYLVESDIDDLIASHETLSQQKIKQLVAKYIKLEDAKNTKKPNKKTRTSYTRSNTKSKKINTKKHNTI
jgi:hypothetical protein